MAVVGKFKRSEGSIMTFSKRFASKKLLIGGFATLALALSVNATASVSAMSGHRANPPVVASQCDHPGYRHFGFADKKACNDFVGQHRPGQGNGYGGNGGSTNTNIFVQIGNVVNGAVNVTINFVTNIFR